MIRKIKNHQRVTPESGSTNIYFFLKTYYYTRVPTTTIYASFRRRVSGGPADRRVIINK